MRLLERKNEKLIHNNKQASDLLDNMDQMVQERVKHEKAAQVVHLEDQVKQLTEDNKAVKRTYDKALGEKDKEISSLMEHVAVYQKRMKEISGISITPPPCTAHKAPLQDPAQVAP